MGHEPICCGCTLSDDYGTSIVTGDGSSGDPFTIAQVDPSFRRPLFRYVSVLTPLAAGIETSVSLDGITVFDNYNVFDVVGEGIIIPLTGLYLFGCQGHFTTGPGVQELILTQNGVDVYGSEDNSTTTPKMGFSYQIKAQQNDVIEFKARSDTATTVRIIVWGVYLGKFV